MTPSFEHTRSGSFRGKPCIYVKTSGSVVLGDPSGVVSLRDVGHHRGQAPGLVAAHVCVLCCHSRAAEGAVSAQSPSPGRPEARSPRAGLTQLGRSVCSGRGLLETSLAVSVPVLFHSLKAPVLGPPPHSSGTTSFLADGHPARTWLPHSFKWMLP